MPNKTTVYRGRMSKGVVVNLWERPDKIVLEIRDENLRTIPGERVLMDIEKGNSVEFGDLIRWDLSGNVYWNPADGNFKDFPLKIVGEVYQMGLDLEMK